MDKETILTQLYQQTALRRRSLEEGKRRNERDKARIEYFKGAADSLELVIKSLGLWESYEKWRDKQCRKA